MCGICGVITSGDDNAARCALFGTQSQQHRGQETVGAAASCNGKLVTVKHKGLVIQGPWEETIAKFFPTTRAALCHNRYSTTGGNRRVNAQPFEVRHYRGRANALNRFWQIITNKKQVVAAIAHNGNLVNADELRQQLESAGYQFRATSDTEVIAHLLAHSWKRGVSFEDTLLDTCQQLRGAFSLGILTRDGRMFAVRDPYGFRPLSIGRFNQAGYMLASETAAFWRVSAEPVRHIERGEIIEVTHAGPRLITRLGLENSRPALCVFELIYLAVPETWIGHEGKVISVAKFRQRIGEILASECPSNTGKVSWIPKTSDVCALAYAETLGLPCQKIISDHHGAHRIFIQPDERVKGVSGKHVPIVVLFEGQVIHILEDSIVRADTLKRVIAVLRRYGIKEVHIVIASPTYRYPCYFGIDTSHHDQLIAAHRSVEEIRQWIGADSLHYLSQDGLNQAIASTGLSRGDYCTACFDGNYPMPVPSGLDKEIFEQPKGA